MPSSPKAVLRGKLVTLRQGIAKQHSFQAFDDGTSPDDHLVALLDAVIEYLDSQR